MTSPTHAVTLDDERYYEWPNMPGTHFPSITTIIKQGVPKPVLGRWMAKKTAELAYDSLEILTILREAAEFAEVTNGDS